MMRLNGRFAGAAGCRILAGVAVAAALAAGGCGQAPAERAEATAPVEGPAISEPVKPAAPAPQPAAAEAPAPAKAEPDKAPAAEAPKPAEPATAQAEARKPSDEEARAAAEERARLERERLAKEFPADAAEWTLDNVQADRPTWRPEKWGNPAKVEIVEQDGKPRLRVTLEPGDKDKAALIRGLAMDCASRGALVLDIENGTEEKVGLALAIVTDEWYETPVVELAPGPNKAVAFDLRAGNFKAASTEWKHAAAVKQLDKPKFVSLLLYTKQAGVFTLGNVRLPKAP